MNGPILGHYKNSSNFFVISIKLYGNVCAKLNVTVFDKLENKVIANFREK